jgi:hypothetical protein
VALTGGTPHADETTLPVMPDPKLTPGAVATTDRNEICRYGYAKSHRVWHDKVGTRVKYGLPLSATSLVEDDDLVPICLGRDNSDPRNHWPEPWDQAMRKDEIEHRACIVA